MILPHGALHTCRSYSTLNLKRGQIVNHIRNHNYYKALRCYLGVWQDLVFRPMDFECGHFTGCPEWMEDIIGSQGEDDMPEEIARIRGRLSPEAIRASTEFIHQKFNPNFSEKIIQNTSE